MKDFETYRVYGKKTKISDNYYELAYTEYRADGTIKCKGTEDFTKERLHSQTKTFDVYCYNGKTMHGVIREGYRMTDCVGTLRVSNNAPKLTVAKRLYENAARVS